MRNSKPISLPFNSQIKTKSGQPIFFINTQINYKCHFNDDWNKKTHKLLKIKWNCKYSKKTQWKLRPQQCDESKKNVLKSSIRRFKSGNWATCNSPAAINSREILMGSWRNPQTHTHISLKFNLWNYTGCLEDEPYTDGVGKTEPVATVGNIIVT